eukprot:g46756.t1
MNEKIGLRLLTQRPWELRLSVATLQSYELLMQVSFRSLLSSCLIFPVGSGYALSTSFQFVGTSRQPLLSSHHDSFSSAVVGTSWQLFSSYLFSWHKLTALHELSTFSSTSPDSPHLPVCWHNLF